MTWKMTLPPEKIANKSSSDKYAFYLHRAVGFLCMLFVRNISEIRYFINLMMMMMMMA